MKTKHYSSLLLGAIILFGMTASAQDRHWTEMMQDPQANFYEVQAAAEAWFETHPKGKGSGWKQYKRWEYYHGLRVKEDGSLPQATEILSEVTAYQARQSAHRRNSQSGNWKELGPIGSPNNGTYQPNGIGRLASLTFHPTNSNILYAGSPGGGIWKSTSKGKDWVSISNGLVRLGVSSIVVHPKNPNTIYIGTGDRDANDTPGYGVWKSTDGGQTWVAWNRGMGNVPVYEILMNPRNPDTLVAGGYYGTYLSTNGGSSWTRTSTISVKDLAFKPGDPSIVYAAGNLFYRSSNGGASFSRVSTGLPTSARRLALGVSPDNPAYVYVLAGAYNGLVGVFRSTNSGVSFTTRSTSPNILGYYSNGADAGSQAWYDLVMTVDPADADIVYTGGINVWKSLNGGSTWRIVTHWTGSGAPAVHADDHVLEWSPHDTALYVGHDGGLHCSHNRGVSWTDITSGMAIAQVYKLGQSATQRNLVINGYQDNGTSVYRNGQWTTAIGGDGMECAIDYSNANYMYGSLYYGEIMRSSNGGASFSLLARYGYYGITERGGWVSPFKLHPSNPSVMFLGMTNVWRCDNVKASAPSWRKISAFSTGHPVIDVAIAPSNPNIVFASKAVGHRLYRSNNAMSTSPSWTSLESGLPGNSTVKDIEIHPSNPNILWIASGTRIYMSTNQGTSWSNYSGTLPGISLNTIVYDRNNPLRGLYVGMDAGVYYRDSTMSDWASFSTSLPPVEITELEIFYDSLCHDGKLRAASYGRGLWESDLRDPGSLRPRPCFAVSHAQACEGETVLLYDQSSYRPTTRHWKITPANFSYVNGTSASSDTPAVVFRSPGNYSVGLLVGNSRGADSLHKPNLISIGGKPRPLPLRQDFDLHTSCVSSSGCAVRCNLNSAWENHSAGEDGTDWRIYSGSTPTNYTGPSGDANGTPGGKYLYLEATSCFRKTAILTSPCLDLRSLAQAELGFSYHMYGAHMGSLHIDVFHQGQWISDVMPALSGDKGNTWQRQRVDLSAYSGSVIKIRIRGITGANYASDIALDNLTVSGSTLDTEFDGFEGEYIEGQGNMLRWTASNNTLGETFLLQRMEKNGDFLTIARQDVTEASQYEQLDPSPFVGINRYRLAVQTPNGHHDYSRIIEVLTAEGKGRVRIFPNPFTKTLYVQLRNQPYGPIAIELRDMQGKRLYHQQVEVSTQSSLHRLDLSDIPAGMYFLVAGEEGFKVIHQVTVKK